MGELDKKLQELVDAHAAKVQLETEYSTLRQQVMAKIPREVLQELEDVKDEFEPKLKAADDSIFMVEQYLRGAAAVLQEGAKVPGGRLTIKRGRTSWDTEGLESYAESHPDVLEYKKVGNPIITISIDKKDAKKEQE